jgi:ABC-type dipeptide/oligopeptide/nickel transport system permease component
VLLAFIFRRTLALGPVLLVVSVAVFLAMRMIPGDPARLMAGPDAAEEDVENIRQLLGLNRPVYAQYGIFLREALAGNLGTSIRSRRPVTDELAMRVPFSLQLAAGGVVIAVLLGVPLGIVAAVYRGSTVDTLVMVQAVAGVSLPVFWLGLLLMLLFAAILRWLPSSGSGTLRHLILPAVTLGLAEAALIARMTRSAMLDVLHEDYVRTARAKGLRELVVIGRHALRNAAIPLVTIVGMDFGRLLGGAVITETVFAWPGIGLLVVDAVKFRDYPVVQGAILFFALAVVLVNLLVDLSYAYLDPRVRYGNL